MILPRRKFIKGAGAALVIAAPAIILPKVARALIGSPGPLPQVCFPNLSSWTPTNALNGADSGNNGFSFRNESTNITISGSRVRVTFTSASNSTWVTSHCSIAKCNSATPPNSDLTPIELLFSGASGFSIAQATSITSDPLNFPINVGDNLIVVMDTTTGNEEFSTTNTNSNNWTKAATTSYNQATVSGFSNSANLDRGVAQIFVC